MGAKGRLKSRDATGTRYRRKASIAQRGASGRRWPQRWRGIGRRRLQLPGRGMGRGRRRGCQQSFRGHWQGTHAGAGAAAAVAVAVVGNGPAVGVHVTAGMALAGRRMAMTVCGDRRIRDHRALHNDVLRPGHARGRRDGRAERQHHPREQTQDPKATGACEMAQGRGHRPRVAARRRAAQLWTWLQALRAGRRTLERSLSAGARNLPRPVSLPCRGDARAAAARATGARAAAMRACAHAASRSGAPARPGRPIRGAPLRARRPATANGDRA